MTGGGRDIRSVLVTGATGFVGTEVCATLVRQGLTVHGLTRNGGHPLPRGIIPHFVSDLSDSAAIRTAVDGVDAVVHLAAKAHVVPDKKSDADAFYRRTNVEGTRVVFECAASAGVRRFVFASSIKVMGDYPGRPWTENDTPAPVDAYGRSKLAAEDLLVRAGSSANMEIAILRLPLIYGPRVRANVLQLFSLVDKGIPLPFRRVRNRRTVVFSRNSAEAILALLRVGSLSRDIFFVGDSQAISTPDLVRGIARGLHRPDRLFDLPPALLRALAKAGDVANAVSPFPLTSAMLERLIGSQECVTTKLESLTGFHPPWSTQEGLAITAEWYAASRASVRPGTR